MRTEEAVYSLVGSELDIGEDGRIWRVGARRGLGRGGGSHIVPCERRRAEHPVPLGYLQVRALIDGKRYHAGAHRLVFRHFFGPIPDGLTINHENGVKNDNRPENLTLATPSEQAVHAFRTGLTCQAGERNGNAKLTTAEVARIRERSVLGERQATIADVFGISFQTVSKIVRGERWSL